MLHSKNIKTILLSGDRKDKTEAVAQQLGIDEVIAEQTPEQKSEWVAKLNAVAPTAMVGDGINDAPALAKASVGISLSDVVHIAVAKCTGCFNEQWFEKFTIVIRFRQTHLHYDQTKFILGIFI